MPAAQVANDQSMFSPLANAVEIISDRLFYASFSSHPSTFPRPKKTCNGKPNRPIHYFCIDNELVYWNFFLDFGPLSLGQLYRFCRKLDRKLNHNQGLSHKHICFFSDASGNRRANAVYLICAYQVLYLNRSPEECVKLLRSQIESLPPFHDASPGICTYDLTVLDCLKGLVKARASNFFNFKTFDVGEYEHYEKVENGDLNWIAQGKILAFAGPQNRQEVSMDGYYSSTPETFINYFQKKKIGLVVRLNKKMYDERKFTKAGIDHYECYYLDGSCPTMGILQRILAAFESVPSDKGFAVHCKAGLGRTGTCIGAYMMKHYDFSAAEAIGWMRICRPGMVIGPQQQFLQEIEEQMRHEGNIMRLHPQKPLLPGENQSQDSERKKNKRSFNIITKLQFGSLCMDDQFDQMERSCGRPGQADELLSRRYHMDSEGVNVS